MHVITSTEALKPFSERMKQSDFVAVDTEFMREKTYWPILCLIQAAFDGEEAIIDPLAEGIDLTPFTDALMEPGLTKVFHAARQDVEIFFHLSGAVPAPIFDTQIAAMACGFGDQIGYEPLMRSLLRAKIDKGSRFTDWSRRPLSDAQLNYAMSDVTHLREAYPILGKQLADKNREGWVASEMEALLDKELYYTAPEAAWKRLKLKGVRQGDLGILIALAQWREETAQERDTPRNRIIRDDSIFELARTKPKTTDDLKRARSLASGMERSKFSQGILDAVAKGKNIPSDQLPTLNNDERPKPPVDTVELLKVLLKQKCAEYDVAQKLIATMSDLEEIALSDEADVPALKGWRRDVFGNTALKLKSGKLALRLNQNSVEVLEI